MPEQLQSGDGLGWPDTLPEPPKPRLTTWLFRLVQAEEPKVIDLSNGRSTEIILEPGSKELASS